MQVRKWARKTSVLGCLADRSKWWKPPDTPHRKRITIWVHQLSFKFVMKQPIPIQLSPYSNICTTIPAGAHKWVARSTRVHTTDQRFVYDGRVLTRFLHALYSKGEYMRTPFRDTGMSLRPGTPQRGLARVHNGRTPKCGERQRR